MLVICFALIMQKGGAVQSASVVAIQEFPILIIDPGHGGEDGGAVASDGTIESHINLSIALVAEDLAKLMGWTVCMTRREDVSIHDNGAQTLREKKVSDLKNRVKLCNRIANGVLISIHQNSLPSAKSVCGAQVFYNEYPGSDELAHTVQSILNQTINQNRNKEPKAIGNSSYLMKNVGMPAILVECGFLSNDREAELLQTSEHQKKLAVFIIAAAAGYLNSTGK